MGVAWHIHTFDSKCCKRHAADELCLMLIYQPINDSLMEAAEEMLTLMCM
jgi:hypothetical protein